MKMERAFWPEKRTQSDKSSLRGLNPIWNDILNNFVTLILLYFIHMLTESNCPRVLEEQKRSRTFELEDYQDYDPNGRKRQSKSSTEF